VRCDRVQAGVSQAIDERRGFSAYERHFADFPDCRDFAAVSVEFAERYRRRVDRGIDRLRRAAPPASAARRSVHGWIALAAAALILLSIPLRRAPVTSPASSPAASARVPLFDGPAPDPIDLGPLAGLGEPPLPRRLDQELPVPPVVEIDSGLALPAGLRF